VLLLCGIGVVTLAAVWWFATCSSASRFLPSGPGEWIVYPTAVDPVLEPAGEWAAITAVFSRTFSLTTVPTSSLVRIRAFSRYDITLNGTRIPTRDFGGGAWKEIRTYDVASGLRKGENTLNVEVGNDVGPPALSLSLTARDETILSDEQWKVTLDGAEERSAHLASAASEPRKGNVLSGGERTFESLRTELPLVSFFALLSVGFMAGVYYWHKRFLPTVQITSQKSQAKIPAKTLAAGSSPASRPGSPWKKAIWLAPIVVWLTLFLNNQRSLPFSLGFDVQGHLAYIGYIEQHHALPLADEGWEMHHPPLYYAIAATLLRRFDVSLDDQGDVSLRRPSNEEARDAQRARTAYVLRSLSLAFGIAQVLLVFACLRLLFPEEPRKQAVGLLLSAFLPAHLYVFHYVSNETLATTLGTAAIYLCLKAISGSEPSTRVCVLLGLCLGAAMLTKVTAILVAAVVLATLVGRLLVQRQRNPMTWLRTVGATFLVTAAVSGWHYGRVWQHFGTPLVGNYDPAAGSPWWQQPGYSTLSYYLRFGRSLTNPQYSAFHGYLDGFYSTLWGDGMWGGAVSRVNRPPWNYDLMTAGYLLALVPTLFILAGTFAAIVQLVRRPRGELFLLIGLPFAFGAASVYQHLRYPYYAHAKAIYVLAAAISVCSFGAWGFDLLARRWKLTQYALGVWLGMWALTSIGAFWIRPDAAATRAWRGAKLMALNRAHQAEHSIQDALAAEPNNPTALTEMGMIHFNESLRTDLSREEAQKLRERAREELEHALRVRPNDPEILTSLGLLHRANGRIPEALEFLRRAVEIGPDYWQASFYLGRLFIENKGAEREAIDALRHGLGIAPVNTELRRALAKLYEECQQKDPSNQR
jgi:tetratricopeptide (TPR) repeat protein